MALGEIVGAVAALVHSGARLVGLIADDLRGASPEKGTPPSPEKGTGVEEEDEMPSIMTGPEALVEMSGLRGDELLHAETRRERWHNSDYLDKSRPHGTRKIGF